MRRRSSRASGAFPSLHLSTRRLKISLHLQYRFNRLAEKPLEHQNLSLVLCLVIDQVMQHPAEADFDAPTLPRVVKDAVQIVLSEGGGQAARLLANTVDDLQTIGGGVAPRRKLVRVNEHVPERLAAV